MAGPGHPQRLPSEPAQAPEPKLKVPRPANPWILYRAAKFAAMRAGLESRITQGSVSRQIAAMWKTEPEHVKQYWERAAEDEKARHQLLYPNYRYCPMKKEDRQREKTERKKNRRKKTAKVCDATSAASLSLPTPSPPPSANTEIAIGPSPSPSLPVLQLPTNMDMVPGSSTPALPFSNNSYLVPGHSSDMTFPNNYYWSESLYGPRGPSPPISAAPSPVPSPDLRSSAVPSSSLSPSTHPSPGSESRSSSSSQLALYHSSYPNSHNPSPNAFVTQSLPPLQLPVFDPLNLEVADFDVPIDQSQAFANFQQGDTSLFDCLQGLLANADGNYLWRLPGTSPDNLLSQPQGLFDVGISPQACTKDYNNQLFANFDYAEFERQMASLAAGNPSFVSAAPLPQEDIQSLFRTPRNPEIQAYAAARQRQPSAFTLEMMKSMDLEAARIANTEAASSDATPIPIPTTIAPHQVGIQNPQHAAEMPIFTQVTNTPVIPSGSSYVPPAGAIYSSTRRVAASWKPPLATPLQMDEPTQMWSSHYRN